jgi:hypothetical protein
MLTTVFTEPPLFYPERQNAKTMEHTLLREVCDFFLFGSLSRLSHQRCGDSLGYLKVVAKVGGEPASVHVESQEKRQPDQQSNRVTPGYESGRLTTTTLSSNWFRGHLQTPFSACKIKKQFAGQDSFQSPLLYNTNTKISSFQKHYTEKLGGGGSQMYQHLPILFRYEDHFLDHSAMLPLLRWPRLYSPYLSLVN